ncbi:YkgJ family cysteine cluster protein [Geobacter sp.]|uniref:YkgJ family cysteine cluster protein n=1 Tax=Geobacter sp. TaxID=46610 RepID=UPI0026153638|nr:YkgJ family cysteine cluster protein [Geobacter sp.]
MDCLKCSTCCTAPDIAALGKALGERCRHLDEGGLCSIYGERPAVCRGYRPDELCRLVAAPTLEERVRKYLCLFGVEGEVGATPRRPGRS